jgi:tetratricopeptide (TPR) repeat protein
MPILLIIIIIGVIGSIFLIFFLIKRKSGSSGSSQNGEKDKSAVIREANKRLAQDPKDAKALLTLGNVYYKEGNWDQAMKNYGLLLDIVSANPELDEFDITVKHALCAMKLKQYEIAYKNFVIARTMNPEPFDINYNLGYLEFMKKNYDTASALLNKARQQNPEHPETLKYLGHSLFRMKRYKEAASMLRKTIELHPEDKESLFLTAQCYYEIGQHDAATKIFSHLRTDPAIGPMSALYSGTINLKNRKLDEAIMDFEIGLRHENSKQETRTEMQYRLSSAYIQKQDIGKAVSLLKEIHEIAPGYKDVAAQLNKYKELNSNKNLQKYLMSTQSEYVSLCRKIVETHFPKSRTKILDISVNKNEYTDILADINTSQWEDLILYRFIRTGGQTGELVLRDLYTRLKEVKAGRGFCLTSGSYTDGAKQFVEARLIDLVDKKELMKILNSL